MAVEGLMATLTVELSSDAKKFTDAISKPLQVAGQAAGGAVKAGQDVVGGIVGGLSPFLKTIQSHLSIVGAFYSAVGPIISMVMKLLGAVILILLMPFLILFLKILSDALPGALKAIVKLADDMGSFVNKFLTNPAGAIGEAVGGIAEAGGQALAQAGQAWDLIVANLPSWLAALSAFGQQILDYVNANLPSWMATLSEWGKIILDFIVANIPTWLNNISLMATAMVDFVTANLPILFGQLLEIGGNMITWLIDHLPEIFIGLLTLGAGILLWMIENLPKILGALYDMGKQLLLFLIANLPVWFVKMIDAGVVVLQWIVAHIPQMFSALLTIGDFLVKALRVVITDIMNGIVSTIANIISAIAAPFLGGGGGATARSPTMAKRNMNDLGVRGGLSDFIWRPGSGAQSFSPDDTLIGMKGSGGFGGGGVNYSPTYNINGMFDDTGVKRMLKEHDNEFLGRLKSYGVNGQRVFNT